MSRSYCAQIRLARKFQNGNAMLLPRALYLDESLDSLWNFPFVSIHSPISVQSSGNPWSRSHSLGVSLRTTFLPITALKFSLSGILCPPPEFLAESVPAISSPFQYLQAHILLISPAQLVLAAPICGLWHTTLRLCPDRADDEHFAAPPIRTGLIPQGYGLVIFMPFKEPLLCHRYHLHLLSPAPSAHIHLQVP